MCYSLLSQINTWLEDVMNERSDDIYRTKGVLSIDGWNERFIFQVGVSFISHCDFSVAFQE
jgi:G3E family GTPase